MFIIAIQGEKQHGKSTISRHLQNKFYFNEVSLAYPIKQICAIVADEPIEYYDDEKKKEEMIPWMGITRRQLMQYVGTELFQNKMMEISPLFALMVGRTIWCKRAYFEIEKIMERVRIENTRPRIVIPDNRMPHEQAFLDETYDPKDILYIRVENPRKSKTEKTGHYSETGVALLRYNAFISNDGTIEQLHDKVDDILESRGILFSDFNFS